MKRTLSLIAVAAAMSFAADIKYGVNAEALLAMPSLGTDGVDPKIGFGANIGGGARITVAEGFAVRPALGFEILQHGTEFSETLFGETIEGTTTVTSKFLTIGLGLEYSVMPNLFLAATPEFNLSLGGSYESEVSFGGESETTDGDIEDEDSPVLLGLGIGYGINEQIAVTAGYKLALSEYGEEYKINKVSVGVRYEL
jgi:outer membrane autotransporter protein